MDVQVGWNDIERAMPSFRRVNGGLSDAKRGIVKLPNGASYFVKIGMDERTRRWAQDEIRAYHWLNSSGYGYAPHIVAESEDGFALPDLSSWDWEHRWHADKLDAALRALDSLAKLSTNSGTISQSGYRDVGNPWRLLPESSEVYAEFIDSESLGSIEALLAVKERYASHLEAGNSEPWRGYDLVHYDARADNFAYDHESNHGCFVDWNWLSLGSTAFDRTALLVNVELSGFDVLKKYGHHIDIDSLVWQAGFWLWRATGPRDTPDRKLLRPKQVANALQAYLLLHRVRAL